MLKFIICCILSAITLVLYCCIRVSTSYDEEIDDLEQERFVTNRK